MQVAATAEIAMDSVVSVVAPTALDPYGQLLKMLMPRAVNVVIYDRDASALWLADGCENPELRELVEEALTVAAAGGGASGRMQTFDNESVYVFLLRDNAGHCLGAVALSCAARNDQHREFEVVYGLLRPALEVLSRELANQYNIGGLQKNLSDRDGDLELLLGGGKHKEDTDDFGSVLRNCIAHLSCPIGALLIPDKNIAVFRTGEGVPSSAGANVLTRTHRHLLALMQVQRRTIVLNKTAAAGPLAALPYKILACPIVQGAQRVAGALVIFKDAAGHDFDLRQIHIVELLARRITHVLQNAYDTATGLLTRPAFEKRALAAMTAAAAKASHCVIYVDIDRLHVLNENHGMHVGDNVIARIAENIRSALTPRMVASRISGDRFAVFLPETELPAAQQFAEAVCHSVNRPGLVIGSKTVDVSASFGVAQVEDTEHPLSHALAGAEAACKAAKDRGRNRVEALQDTDRSIVRRVEDVMIIGAVREALEHDRFRLEAQPMVGLQGCGETRHYELLLRMIDNKGETLAPDKFLLAAERYQLAPAIDRWVVQFVLETLSAAAPKLLALGAQFAVNISGQSLGDEEFLSFLESKLRAYALPPSLISFELTETAAVSNIVRAESLMRKLRDLGHEIALDDFGRGLSSLTYLKSLPVTCVKIDGELVRDVAVNARSQAMVSAVVQLARAMKLKTTAECVESLEIQHTITELGVDHGQGFAIGRPRPLELVLKELLSGHKAHAAHTTLRNAS